MNNKDITAEAVRRATITKKKDFTVPELFPEREWETLLASDPHNNGSAISRGFKRSGGFKDTGRKRNGRKVYEKYIS